MAWSKSSDINVFDHLHGIFVIFIKEDNKMTLLCPKSRFIISTQTMPKKSFLMDIILYYLYLYLLVHLYICIDAYLDLEPNMAESRQNWRNLSRLAQL